LAVLRWSRGRLIVAFDPPQDSNDESGGQANKEQACHGVKCSDQPSAIWWHHIAVTEGRQGHDGEVNRRPEACHHVQRDERKRPDGRLKQQRSAQQHNIDHDERRLGDDTASAPHRLNLSCDAPVRDIHRDQMDTERYNDEVKAQCDLRHGRDGQTRM